MSDLTDMLSDPDFKTGDYTVTRRAAPTYTSGEVVAGSTSTFTTGDASLQPASGETLEVLPQGVHTQDVQDLWTTSALRAKPVPDTLAIGSETFEVFTVRKHVGMGGTHYVVGLARLQVAP